jgi:hypothetical protein
LFFLTPTSRYWFFSGRETGDGLSARQGGR